MKPDLPTRRGRREEPVPGVVRVVGLGFLGHALALGAQIGTLGALARALQAPGAVAAGASVSGAAWTIAKLGGLGAVLGTEAAIGLHMLFGRIQGEGWLTPWFAALATVPGATALVAVLATLPLAFLETFVTPGALSRMLGALPLLGLLLGVWVAVSLAAVSRHESRRRARWLLPPTLPKIPPRKDAPRADCRPPRRPVQVTAAASMDSRCPVCDDPLGVSPAVACSRCDTQHHADCWKFTGGCATYGCDAGPG
jgi:hypothetical protein